MLEAGQVYVHEDGSTIAITLEFENSIGSVFWASLTVGQLRQSVAVTEQGLVEAGYALQEPAPEQPV